MIADGAHKGMRQCNGRYELQTNPVNGIRDRCALTGKGISYWDWIPKVMNLSDKSDYERCPFAGGWYQWMRNLVAAAALGRDEKRAASFVVVYVDGPFPMALRIRGPEWARLVAAVSGHAVTLRSISYQRVLEIALGNAAADDVSVLEELRAWMTDKFSAAAV